ncbi:MAG: hypothetical protein JKX76_15490 [Colwellia sp.]|nr:hypothetical protein [Colwellia sp.]
MPNLKRSNIDLAAFTDDLKKLLDKYNVRLGVDIEGDTHGVTENFVVIDSQHNEHILNHYSAYVDASDL